MPNEFNERDEPAALPPDIRAAFKEYPLPKAGPEFDARFWSELDARQDRYRGFVGFWRRLIEVEIEGIAVWRLGFSLGSGAAFCGLALALLSLGPAKAPQNSQVAINIDSNEIPTAGSYFARGVWDDSRREFQPLPQYPSKPKKERTSCVSFAHAWA